MTVKQAIKVLKKHNKWRRGGEGKQPVYTEIDGKQVRLLCDPETLTINGFID